MAHLDLNEPIAGRLLHIHQIFYALILGMEGVQGIYYKNISLETLHLLVSNGIIFVLYNLYFIS
jgi:hypothetical protein